MGAACGGGERKGLPEAAPEVVVQDPAWMNYKRRRKTLDLDALTRRESVSADASGFRLPVIGVLQGRLTETQLMDIWDKYDKDARGTLKTGATVPLVREIIFSIPELLKESFDAALDPLKLLAAQTGDEEDKKNYELAKEDMQAQLGPELHNLTRQIKGMDEATLGILIERLVELMDLDNDGSVDLDEYLDVFAPKGDSTFQQRYEAKMEEIKAAAKQAEEAARQEAELEEAEEQAAAKARAERLDGDEEEEEEEPNGPAADEDDDDEEEQVDVAQLIESTHHKRKPSFAGSASDMG